MASDKDSWVAENIIPKNPNFNQTRKPRANVLSVDSTYASRKTKITLCVLGSWAIYMPPYNLARLSALTREAGYLTRVYDFNIQSYHDMHLINPQLAEDAWNSANFKMWGLNYEEKLHSTYEPLLNTYIERLLSDSPDIIGFSVYYTNILPTLWVAEKIKKIRPDITILLGGPECHHPEFSLPKNCDYFFVGESEKNLLDFLDSWEKGIKPDNVKIGSTYSDTRIDLDSLPYPDYSDFDLSSYLGQNSVCSEISRGCVAQCTYCTETYYWKFRDRGSKNVLDEIEYQVKKYGITHISFVDSLMNGNLKEFKRFCEGIIDRKLNITWWGYARCDGRMDFAFYQLLKAAGAQGFNYGIESGSDKVLTFINKKNTVAEINKNLLDSHAVGLKVSACFVLGSPGEDMEAYGHTLNLLWNHRSRINAVSPGPGLGDAVGTDYDNREKYNINKRGDEWMSGWYTLDFTNTKLHRYIRVKLIHIWLHICNESTTNILTNVHSTCDITKHFNLEYDSSYINDEVAYENFNYNVIKSGFGDFADSSMNEIFSFLRLLWRVRGGYEITLHFDPEVDRKYFAFLVDQTYTFETVIHFKINDRGDYKINANFNFVNHDKQVVNIDGYNYTYNASGKWDSSVKIFPKKTFFISKSEERSLMPLARCFSGMSYSNETLLLDISRRLPNQSTIVEVASHLGGKAAILANGNKSLTVHSFETFEDDTLIRHFGYIQKHLEDNLKNMCDLFGLPESHPKKIINDIQRKFVEDPSGKSVWEFNTNQHRNIQLHQISSFTAMPEWINPVDVCLLNLYSNPEISYNINFWCQHIKSNGYLILWPYNKERHPDLVSEVDKLINNSWKIRDKNDDIIILWKP